MGRFINADAYASTGQCILGNNMFAYCLNNPVCLSDSLGAAPTEAVDVDGDGKVDYYRYEYTYTYTIFVDGIKMELTLAGNVYYFPNIRSPKNLNSSDYPKDFDKKSDIIVGNYVKTNDDGSKNPVLYAYQAQRLRAHAYSSAIECMLQIDEDFNLGLERSHGSMMIEWGSHMILGGKFGLSRTANIDFDHDAEGLTFGDYCSLAWREFWGI
jgi:hypothetical protein